MSQGRGKEALAQCQDSREPLFPIPPTWILCCMVLSSLLIRCCWKVCWSPEFAQPTLSNAIVVKRPVKKGASWNESLRRFAFVMATCIGGRAKLSNLRIVASWWQHFSVLFCPRKLRGTWYWYPSLAGLHCALPLVRRPHSSYQRVVQGKCPLHFLIWMGSIARTLFSRTLLPWPAVCYSGEILHARFSNTSFGRTLLGSNFGGRLLEQTFCRHCAAFPIRLYRYPHISSVWSLGGKAMFKKHYSPHRPKLLIGPHT